MESLLPDIASFLRSLALVPLTLLPIINPVSGAAIFVATAGNNPRVVRAMARQVAVSGWIILVTSMLVGTYVLEIFGISLPIVRIGGGLLVATYGWQLLHDNGTDAVQDAVAQHASDVPDTEIVRRSFFPMTFPLTVGPGCISASIALGANLPSTPMLYLEGATVAAIGAAITVVVVYLCYRNAAKLLRRFGDVGTLVMRRLMAFILLCIGIEIMWAGWAELNHIAS
ncbi:MAG TPA: MarC family protein [Rhodocyclaceae bacterium]|nr:MarC family protein [Rhodocyclaceae bacterium]